MSDLRSQLLAMAERHATGAHYATGASPEALECLLSAKRAIAKIRQSTKLRQEHSPPIAIAVALATLDGVPLMPPPRRRAALGPCDVCGAGFGARCVTADGQPAKRAHGGRTAL